MGGNLSRVFWVHLKYAGEVDGGFEQEIGCYGLQVGGLLKFENC